MQPFIEYIREETYQEAIRRDVPCDVAFEIAAAVEHNVRQSRGGRHEYVHSVDRVKRNIEIMNDFSGRNHNELCRKWGICRRMLEYIIKAHYEKRDDSKVNTSSQSG